MRPPVRRGAAAAILLVLLSAAPLAGQQTREGPVETWLGTKAAEAYAAIGTTIASEAAKARELGVPEALLVERLDEAAVKRVAPAQLAAALELDLARYASLLGLLSEAKALPEAASARASLLRQGAILLRTGYTEAELRAILSAAARQGGAPGPKAADPEAVGSRAFRAAAIALDAALRYSLSGGTRARLGSALAASALPAERFEAILSLLARAKGLGLPLEGAATALEAGLRRGSSLDALERELLRRAK